MLRKLRAYVPVGGHTGVGTRNTAWMLAGFTGRLGAQFIYFVIVARTLKPEEYGSFAGSVALALALAPFVSWGSGNILIKHVSRDANRFSESWGAALTVTLISALLLCALSVVLGSLWLSLTVGLALVLPVAFGTFFGDSVAILCSQAFQAHERLSRSSILVFGMGFYRLLSASLLLFLPISKSSQNWCLLYMGSGLLAGMTGLLLVKRELGWGRMGLGKMRGQWREGFFFSIGTSAEGSSNDIDKTLMVRLASEAAAGTYAATYRIMDAASIPIRAMVFAGYPRFFQQGEKGTREASDLALRLVPWSAAFGIVAWFGLILLAPLIPLVLGNEYAETSRIAPWLAPIPFFRAWHYLAANALTGAGYQGLRSSVYILIALLNLCLNLWLIPKFGWLGAAWSSLVSDGLLAVVFWGCALTLAAGKPNKTANLAK